MRFDPSSLRAALAAVPAEAWSQPSTVEATGVHHGYRRVVLVQAGHRYADADPFLFVLADLAPVREAWLSHIDPGGYILPHRDAGPWWDRWQVPIATAGWLDTDTGRRDAVDGEAFRVEHWRTHSVSNPTDRPRVHLVIDRDVIARAGSDPFTKEPPDG